MEENMLTHEKDAKSWVKRKMFAGVVSNDLTRIGMYWRIL